VITGKPVNSHPQITTVEYDYFRTVLWKLPKSVLGVTLNQEW
jgi:hypothetical protein